MLCVIDFAKAKAHVDRILEHALKKENWYRPGEGVSPVPGDKPEHVLRLGPYRAVFSITVPYDGEVEEPVRMLSVSRVGAMSPSLDLMFIKLLVDLFGFTELKCLGENEEEHTLVVAEPYQRGAVVRERC